MKLPLQLSFRNMERSKALEDHIRERAQKLDRFSPHIIGLHVIVEAPHRHHREGKLYSVRFDITVPGAELVVTRQQNEDVHVALRDAFDAARRLLEDYERRRRRQVKQHEPLPLARVAKLFPESGYGFLETPDGREIFFHENAVLEGGFRKLEVGSEVRFVEEEGERGPQASTVHPTGRAHPLPGPELPWPAVSVR